MDMTITFAPVETAVVVANVLPSGAGFAVRLDDGANCYIPANVGRTVNISVGGEYTAKLVANRFPDKADRTPWLTVHMTRTETEVVAPRPVQYAMPFEQFELDEEPQPALPSTADRVRKVLRNGGVWTVASLFEDLFPGKTRGDGLTEYNAVSAAVRAMYSKGECSKFQLWRSSDQSKPSREWFTCYPEKADVDEWEE